MVSKVIKLCLNIIIAVNIQSCLTCHHEVQEDAKAFYKAGVRVTPGSQETPLTLDKIKTKLKEARIFNPDDRRLSYRDKKELNKLFTSVEIMMASRSRQPANVQNMFSSLRLVERAVKKQLKEGQISESLAAKFHWENLYFYRGLRKLTSSHMKIARFRTMRHKRERPSYVETTDNNVKMRIFDVTY